jgi:cryptochrome
LYISWTKGQEVFEEWLLDADWSLNAANWQWLSASAFFHQYFRVYSPIAFGKKTDKEGDYIRKYIPVLKKFPSKYIFEPWTAPPAVQKMAGCIIGDLIYLFINIICTSFYFYLFIKAKIIPHLL